MSEFIRNTGLYESPHTKEKASNGEVTVIKIGGSTYEEREATLKDVALLHQQGQSIVLVHGGGKEIDKALEKAGIATPKIDGIRVTDPETLKIVVEVLEGINGVIRTHLANLGISTCGFLPDHGLLQADKVQNPELGLVGDVPDVSETELSLLQRYVSEGVVPVICPVSIQKGNQVQRLNVNADTSAGAVAAALPKARFVLLTDVPGVMDEGKLLSELTPTHISSLKQKGVISGGMVPKIDACLSVVEKGGSAIICGQISQAFLPKSYGTVIKETL